MSHFTPTIGIMDTARNARNFTKENMSVFWEIFKPFMVFITASLIIDIAVLPMVLKDPNSNIGTSNIVSLYFLMCLAISWHRVVIHGPDKYVPVNPLKPQKDEWIYIGTNVLIALAVGAIISGVVGIGFMVNPALVIPLIILSGIILNIIFFKLLFFFPSKATGNTISLQQSFVMTNGYVGKLMLASLIACLFYIVITIFYVIVSAALATAITFTLPIPVLFIILQLMIALPILLFLQPMLVIISITVLSNYYQYALQNTGTSKA